MYSIEAFSVLRNPYSNAWKCIGKINQYLTILLNSEHLTVKKDLQSTKQRKGEY